MSFNIFIGINQTVEWVKMIIHFLGIYVEIYRSRVKYLVAIKALRIMFYWSEDLKVRKIICGFYE